MPSKHGAQLLGLPNGRIDRQQAARESRSRWLERWLLRRFMILMGSPAIRVVLWDGEEVYSAPASAATIEIHDRRTLFRLIRNPDLHFGDSYSSGNLTISGDLVACLEAMYRSEPLAGLPAGLVRWWGSKRLSANSRRSSRQDIHHHYDLGNDFYRLWLDDKLLYTCAYFPSAEASLEDAQAAKMEHVCRKVALRPGERVIEAGCGWGALALHMARHHGVTVRAFNISHEQIEYAREQARYQGLADRVEFVEDDYRNISGTCDAFVSVGMLEHVGPPHYQELGRVIDRSLSTNGRGLIHSIGRDRPRPMSTWIERRIFPGAYPPTLREMMAIFEPFDLSVLDVENLRLHYAKTLEHWLERYGRASEAVTGMFDSSFMRAWRLYLAGSMVGFRTGTVQLFQVVFARGETNQIPWTRAHVYAAGESRAS